MTRSNALEVTDNKSITVVGRNTKHFGFDQVFDETCDQETVYKRTGLEYLVSQVVQGFHATVFVYGQTGSGKTFTMDGYKYQQVKFGAAPVIEKPQEHSQILKDDGMIPRAIKNLFQLVQSKRSPQNKIIVTIQYIQLYNERIYDLLNKTAQQVKKEKQHGLKLKYNVQTDEVTVENVFVFQCETVEDALKYFWKGMKNKIMASHQMNQNSSRSHCVLTFTVHQISTEDRTSSIVSKLQLVDLAGSERQSQTQTTEINQTLLKESIEINKSLFTLRQVISALTENSSKPKQPLSYVPYRESKLTTILRQSLGGNSFCLMIACIAPIDLYADENISTLSYAARASQISNAPQVNIDPRLKQIIEQKDQIARLQVELKRANDTIKFITQGGCICKSQPPQAQSHVSNQGELPCIYTPQATDKEFGFSHSQFSALQQKLRHPNGSPEYNQDRLINSISVIKEVLLSNMQLRDDLLVLSQEHEAVNKNNYQLTIENEDLRDRLNLLGESRDSLNIEYMPYIAAGSVEKLCDSIQTRQELRDAKITIFNHIFSLQKDNRALLKRMNSQSNRTVSPDRRPSTVNIPEPSQAQVKVMTERVEQREMKQIKPVVQGLINTYGKPNRRNHLNISQVIASKKVLGCDMDRKPSLRQLRDSDDDTIVKIKQRPANILKLGLLHIIKPK